MAKESKPEVPNQEQVIQAGVEAMQAVKGQPGKLKELLADVTADDVVMNDHEIRYLKANQNSSGGWLHGPASLETFAATEEQLLQASAERGRVTRAVKRVRAAIIPRKRLVFIWPTTDEDPDGIAINRYGSSLRINLSALLASSGLRVRSGYRERYDIQYASAKESQFGPAIWFDLGKPLERRRAMKKKSESSSDETEQEKAEAIQPETQQQKTEK